VYNEIKSIKSCTTAWCK